MSVLMYAAVSVWIVRGWEVEPTNCFLSHCTHCQIMYWGVSNIWVG